MLTGIALVRRLGDHLMLDPPLAPDPGFAYLFDGTDAQFANWQMAGGGSFSRFGRMLIAQQDARGIGLLFYTPERFENFPANNTVHTRSWMHALVSAMRDHIDQPKARQAQQADKDQGNGVYDHTMPIIILAFRAFVFREVGNR